ncbi:hypothetical protein C343_06166 [Cryptococcus neoformans C23]|uniref:Glycoprotein n=1 Tax=Cryptococcus neoformans (strain H99 / ATCC 208821 / CBS 10515 / FGSC 9487) TaxID=235443 RepID=J9VUN8_CRYN9|nr:hypothetical protein CNAG_01993 [Cryptococcus neoformans var. grubii H99]AUB28296.1 hypothetical protein CKF44_01993 [Cryptococcus neoformans var. grubii]OWZ39544.1 hypothetical protein C343_06166 [Cryptococcus neoformans var. grubii C23]OXC81694.1 hypothetical protein C344_06066 [Cryptococcus neoformans var. grubii AD1-7a]OXG36877.1 hypothetical protein C360_02001 [Cryptococcus neoformans var. grubii Bt15]OXG44015.1 hypothetical protein C359_01121 [Cryptococcus neoformans var. grubii Bt120|eukprot:XP_012052895.1 hypothetical protein CNAG_01993 [Cryptococcus neoformans var. grubii H99]
MRNLYSYLHFRAHIHHNMRTLTVLVSFGLLTSAIAAPGPRPRPPPFFLRDPLSIHRKSFIPPPIGDDELTRTAVKSLPYGLEAEFADDSGLSRFTSSSSTPSSSSSSKGAIVKIEMEAYEAEDAETEDTCANVCGVTRVEGASSEQEALCSPAGLKATYACAQCMDKAWSGTTWENSALAEYERIASACEGNDSSQRPIRRKSSNPGSHFDSP